MGPDPMTDKEHIVALSPTDVARLAALARITLTDEELRRLAPQLDMILDAVADVSRVAGDDVARRLGL